jgi:hypothetical protein
MQRGIAGAAIELQARPCRARAAQLNAGLEPRPASGEALEPGELGVMIL